ncbi:MAG TPA: hypothetical protein VLI67_01455 [Vicinamibacteria bacterium]|nr:hypothetical protein [Vicinamibacteria bacterium]
MSEPSLLSALGPVLDALHALGVRHYVGGSLASSAHGIPRASLDADVVAELGSVHVGRFVAALRDAYYVSEDRVHERSAGARPSTSSTSPRCSRWTSSWRRTFRESGDGGGAG